MADFSERTPEEEDEDNHFHSQMDGGSTVGYTEKSSMFLYVWAGLTVVIFIIIVF